MQRLPSLLVTTPQIVRSFMGQRAPGADVVAARLTLVAVHCSLVDIVTSMTRTEALSAFATKAASIVALMRATPEQDTASDLLRRGARVRGKAFDVKKASSRAIARATSEVRSGKTPAGRVVTKEERATCLALQKALRAAGAKDAKVTVKAGRAARAARATIDLLVREIALITKAVRAMRQD